VIPLGGRRIGETSHEEVDEVACLRRREVEGFRAPVIPPQADVDEASVKPPGGAEPNSLFIDSEVATRRKLADAF
jgi:hypothetical protein